MPNPMEAAVVGRVAIGIAEELAPKAVSEGLNLLAAAERNVATALPPDIRAAIHIGPNDGMIEIAHSTDHEIVKARAFEAESRTPYMGQDLTGFPQLKGTKKTDTLVIGGGFTGLTVADKLAANGVHTILVDAGKIGEGTSHFATGMITRAGDPSFAELGEKYGEKTLERYTRGMVNAHQQVMQRASRLGAKVDFKTSDSHMISYDQSAVEEWMGAEHKAASKYDHGIRIVTGPKASQIFEPAKAAMTFVGEGQLNPAKYTKQIAQNARHPIFENTQIVGLQAGKPGGPITAFTADGGRIEANRVVFATGTGGNMFRNLDHCVEGAQCFAAIAETKTPVKLLGNIFDTDGAVREAGGMLRNRNTEGAAYNYFRTPTDHLVVPNSQAGNHIVFGGADRVLSESAAMHTTPELEQQLHTLFPDSKIVHKWNGLLEESVDGMPIIARHGEIGQIIGIRGVGGSGLDSSQFVANELAKTLKGGDSVLSATRFQK